MDIDDIDLLFDTNILIYLAKGDEKYLHMFEKEWMGQTLGISVISILESLMGVKNAAEESILSQRLQHICIVPLSEEIAFAAVHSLKDRAQKNLRGPHTGDTIIAHTALALNVPLVTNNPKDFSMFEDLTLITP